MAANAAVNDTLELAGAQSGGDRITLGTQFTGFQTVDFASGASWTVAVGTGAGTLTINGLASGDKIDVTNLAPTVVSADFNSANNTLRSTDGTLNFAGIGTTDTFLPLKLPVAMNNSSLRVTGTAGSPSNTGDDALFRRNTHASLAYSVLNDQPSA